VAWLLTSGGISSSDRHWLQGKLDELRARGLEEDEPELMAPAAKSFLDVDGPAQVQVGQARQFVVQSKQGTEQIRCTIDGQVVAGPNPLTIDWTPAKTGAYMLACEAGKHRHRALVQALPSS
jgi:hypothetical protein